MIHTDTGQRATASSDAVDADGSYSHGRAFRNAVFVAKWALLTILVVLLIRLLQPVGVLHIRRWFDIYVIRTGCQRHFLSVIFDDTYGHWAASN